jgi:hypothetical protein
MVYRVEYSKNESPSHQHFDIFLLSEDQIFDEIINLFVLVTCAKGF